MSAEIPCQWQYLAPKARSHYRQLFIKGTRIAARTLYGYFTPSEDWTGQTVEELPADFNLPVAAVREAIAYCQSSGNPRRFGQGRGLDGDYGDERSQL